MKITKIVGREILDSRGFPTVECLIFLNNDLVVNASVPTGLSRSKFEAFELRDNENQRYFGKGVQKAIDIINNIIAPQFVNKPPNAIDTDVQLLQMDQTNDKNNLGANTILAVSMAMYRAHAVSENIELYDFIAMMLGSELVSIPIPMINLINGGLHADNKISIQEYLLVPYGAKNIKEAIEKSSLIFNSLKFFLKEKNKNTGTGDEGGFASEFENSIEPFEIINNIFDKLKIENDLFALAIDVAASQFYVPTEQVYNFDKKSLTSDELINLYVDLTKKYNIIGIEDGLDQEDWQGWIKLMNAFGNKTHIIGDDIFASHPERISKGVEFCAVNSVLIKPNQIGTVTETLQAIQLCQDNGLSTIVSHRSGETNDSFIVDLAVGSRANYIKCGGLSHGERISKYNRLLEIENSLNGIDDI